MKRALAERAKHTTFEKTTTTATAAPSSPPHKVPRLEHTTSKQPEQETAPDESSAFYLKHQNRALATELQSLRHSVTILEQERDARRSKCREAAQTLLAWQQQLSIVSDTTEATTPASTGTGDSVEWTSLLTSAIEGLKKQQNNALTPASNGEQQIQQAAELQSQITELVASRTQLHQRERRIRRNVYRMSAGMLTPEQVVESLDKDDELEASVRLEKAEKPPVVSNGTEAPLKTEDTATDEAAVVDSTIVKELESKIEILEATIRRSEESIQKLNAMVTEKDQKITDLSLRQLTKEDEGKIEELERTRAKLGISESTSTALREKLNQREKEWAQALGNEAAVADSVDELIQKFNKRWCELTGSEQSADDETKMIPMVSEDRLETELARKNADLQHRLDQAMENVRQADSTRETLKSALSLNAAQQTKLDEVTGKYAAVQAARGVGVKNPNSKSGGNHKDSALLQGEEKSKAKPNASNSQAKPSGHLEGKTNGESGGENYEKLYMAYKKLKRDLATTMTSKETAKAKLERAEKEREGLMDTNIKLVRQIGEKEDMNAQSLSTILHLKNLTEKLKEERDLLEQEAKSASQLALAARLTTNAKSKVSEELLNEKGLLLSRIQDLEKVCTQLRTDLEAMASQCSEATGKLALKDIELGKAVARSSDLAKENEEKREEIRKLHGQCEAAEKETKLIREQMAGTAVASGGEGNETATFSVKQLQTQVHFLKNRLACPVCHYRDKECIIMRCRHMHCKACVDERVSNRSRKCPTCNLKFSENDVQDVWLN